MWKRLKVNKGWIKRQVIWNVSVSGISQFAVIFIAFCGVCCLDDSFDTFPGLNGGLLGRGRDLCPHRFCDLLFSAHFSWTSTYFPCSCIVLEVIKLPCVPGFAVALVGSSHIIVMGIKKTKQRRKQLLRVMCGFRQTVSDSENLFSTQRLRGEQDWKIPFQNTTCSCLVLPPCLDYLCGEKLRLFRHYLRRWL